MRHVGYRAVATAILLLGLVAGVPAGASAEPVGAEPPASVLSAKPVRTWQADNTVWTAEQTAGVLFVGGSFTAMRPPGAALGTQEVPQGQLAALDATTGELITTFAPQISGGDVQALSVSPDGRRLYVGGTFTTVNGTERPHLAGFDLSDPRNPTLLSTAQFDPRPNAKVNALDSTNDTVYAGGSFTSANGEPRTRVAAFAAAGGQPTSWKVQLAEVSAAGYTVPFVTAVRVDPATGNVAVGGLFDRVNGQSQHGLALVDGSTGASVPGFTPPTIIRASYVTDAAFDQGRLYVVGRDDVSGSRTRLEGVMAMDASTGQVLWGSDGSRCLGDSFAVLPWQGPVWAGTPAPDCSQIGGYPERRPPFYGAVLGQAEATGEQLHFYPTTTGVSGVTGSFNNVRAFAARGDRLFVVGGFAKMGGIAQQNITAFDLKTDGGAAPSKTRPTATVDSTGNVRVSWRGALDDDDRILTYTLLRDEQPIHTVKASSRWWQVPTMSVVDERGATSTTKYKVRVSDGTNVATSIASPPLVAAGPATTYRGAVRADSPGTQWTLDEPAGSTSFADGSGNGDTATLQGTDTVVGTVGRPYGATRAVKFNGSSSLYGTTPRFADGGTIEVWFQTATQTGGKIVGFGNTRAGTSTVADKQLYMTDSGQVVFGVQPGLTTPVTLTSPTALNNNRWHHIVATQGQDGMRLYVDGQLVGSNTETRSRGYGAFLRAGGDTLAGWPQRPTAANFTGKVDEVVWYPSALSTAQVQRHWALR